VAAVLGQAWQAMLLWPSQADQKDAGSSRLRPPFQDVGSFQTCDGWGAGDTSAFRAAKPAVAWDSRWNPQNQESWYTCYYNDNNTNYYDEYEVPVVFIKDDVDDDDDADDDDDDDDKSDQYHSKNVVVGAALGGPAN
jgi:hypothetical protein